MFSYMFKKYTKDAVQEVLKYANWDTCFYKQERICYDFGTKISSPSYRQIKYSGRTVQTSHKLYECLIEGKVEWVAEVYLEFPVKEPNDE